jgi:uridine kinase
VITKKYIFIACLLVKYLFLSRYIPFLEQERYLDFFDQCTSFASCLNPYNGISGLENQFLTFPYGNFMYFVLIPFFFFGKFLGISFVVIAYFFFELTLIIILEKIYQVSKNHFIFIVIFNPLLIYSAAYLGQLDFIPLTYFIASLYFLKVKKKYPSLFFIVLAVSSKIVFIILFLIILIYFLRVDESNNELFKTIGFVSFFIVAMNFQFFIDSNYAKTVLYGIKEGYEAVSTTTSLFSNNILFISIFLTFSLFLIIKNTHRLDFNNISIASGLMTIPLYMSNISNIGWLIWSFVLIFIIYYSYSEKVKILVYSFQLLLVAIDLGSFDNILINQLQDIIYFFVLLGCLLIITYGYQILISNKYYKIKSSPLILSITGDSAVGKTTMTKILSNFFGVKFVDNIELDSFHLHERSSNIWQSYTHLNPEMNDLQEYRKTINRLLSGENLKIKNYNHLTGKFDSTSEKKIKNFLIIEGLHSMYFEDLTSQYDLNIFLDLEESIKEQSKISRDLERGKTEDIIKKEIEERKSDYKKYIETQAEFADVYIKTLERNEDHNLFEIWLRHEDYNQLEILLNASGEFVIIDNIKEDNLIKFSIKIDHGQVKKFFFMLSENIENLRSVNFKLDEFSKVDDFELLSKLAFIIYVLEKRLSEKINYI